MPFGWASDFDRSSSRADSSVEAATTTTLARASRDRPLSESMNDTPRALPVFLSTRISRAMEFVRSVRLPVSIAG